MAFNFSSLEPQIHQILAAPGTDLATISAKRVRRQLLDLDPSLTPEFLKINKDDVDAVIASVFEKVSAAQGQGYDDAPEPDSKGPRSRKRKEEPVYNGGIGDEGDEEEDAPPTKKAKKHAKNGRELSDAELARKLSNEINSRSLRTAGKGRGSSNSVNKKGGRTKKSAAVINSDDDSDDDDTGSKRKSRKPGGTAKGGFAKEYVLSEPLAALLQIDKLSRPQVVKQLWVYIKGNELQNPSNKREIVCDHNLKAVFGVEKIDMFRMNKVLGQHLHENEG